MVRKTQTKKQKRKNKSIKNKKRLMKGGVVGPTIITLTTHNPIKTALKDILDVLSNDKLIYVSIGSKYTEPRLENGQYTNSIFQMIPFFLCNDSSARIDNPKDVINIMIDVFSSGDLSLERTISEIGRLNNWVDDSSNITMFIIDLNTIYQEIMLTHKLKNQPKFDVIKEIIETITETVRDKHIDSRNYMVCNYVKFKHPNASETEVLEKMPETVHNALDKYGYTGSEYNWLGYNPIFYNFIYQGNLPTFLLPRLIRNNYRSDKAYDNASVNRELLYRENNDDLKSPLSESEFLTNNFEMRGSFFKRNSDKMFLIVDPFSYLIIEKKQNNFVYSLKELRDSIYGPPSK